MTNEEILAKHLKKAFEKIDKLKLESSLSEDINAFIDNYTGVKTVRPIPNTHDVAEELNILYKIVTEIRSSIVTAKGFF
jgi:hypothetical protein